MLKSIFSNLFIAFAATAVISGCSSPSQGTKGNPQPVTPVTPPVTPVTFVKTDVAMWLTQADQSQLFQRQNIALLFNTTASQNPTIHVDTTQTYQTIDGFGFALTDGSASVINGLNESQKTALLNELFRTDTTNIGISYLRITLGASDLSVAPFSYDDTAGDTNLANFSLAPDNTDLIPILKRILAINPSIKILACPWSAPAWMKDNGSFSGGSLKPENFDLYAKYFVKYINGMKAAGINIDAVTPQNEPLNAYNNPAMVMQAMDEATFVKNNLGAAFQAAGITTKILVYDHNADHPEYATSILADPVAAPFVDGSAFHLYAGRIDALGGVHTLYPNKNIYFTEQATFSTGNFAQDLSWHLSNLIIGATRNWSKNVLEWNLASDPNFQPHTDGGCSTCQGAITIGLNVSRNVSYYIVAHASKFVRPGAVRIASDIPITAGTLENVAFKNKDGSKVLIVLNSGSTQSFNISFNSKMVNTVLQPGAVATYVWH